MDTTKLAKGLRIAAGVLGALALAGGVVLLAGGGVPAAAGLWLFIIGSVLLTAAAFEQMRYRARNELAALARHATQGRAGAGLQRTDEVFEDPTSGTLLRVWYDPSTGEREYRAEP